MLRSAVLGAVAVAVLLLTGCSGAHGSLHAYAGKPAGGWPQPVGGNLTDKMCGLLSQVDMVRVGLKYEPYAVPNLDLNALFCVSIVHGQFWLVLQPDAQSGKLLYDQWQRAGEKDRATKGVTADVATGVVPGADQSLDVTTPATNGDAGNRTVTVRRGALLVTVRIDDAESGPAAATLAGLILSRVPDLGRTDTGPGLSVTYQVTGSGRLSSLEYLDPLTGAYVKAQNVALPWTMTLPYVLMVREQVPRFEIDATGKAGTELTCRITADGAQRAWNVDFSRVFCQAGG